MRAIVLALALTATAARAQQTPVKPYPHSTALATQIDALIAAPAVARAHWGIAVTTLDGTPIYGHDEGKLFRPASTNKLFTTAAAMALLGPDARVRTFIEAAPDPSALTSPADRNPAVFNGLLAIIGDGDAFLSARQVPYLANALRSAQPPPPNPLRFFDDAAAALARTGVRVVKGTIIANDAIWGGPTLPDTWSLEDMPWGYGAPVSALSVNDNQLQLTLTPGRDIFSKTDTGDFHAVATLAPDTGFYTVTTAVDTVAGRPANVWVEHPTGPRSLAIYGHIPPGEVYVTQVAIDDPVQFAAEALKAALIRRGISVEAEVQSVHGALPGNDSLSADLPGDLHRTTASPDELYQESRQLCAAAGCTLLQEHISPTLAEDVAVTLKVSQNLHAELMLRRLGIAYGTDGSFADGVWVIRQWLTKAGLDPADFVFYDGSGLSTKDLVTPRAEAKLLSFAATQPWFLQWRAALPIGGVDGTLASRFTAPPLKGHVFAKTGTLGESRALAGYVDCASGRRVIFSIMVDNHLPEDSVDRSTTDKIVAAIAAAN